MWYYNKALPEFNKPTSVLEGAIFDVRARVGQLCRAKPAKPGWELRLVRPTYNKVDQLLNQRIPLTCTVQVWHGSSRQDQGHWVVLVRGKPKGRTWVLDPLASSVAQRVVLLGGSLTAGADACGWKLSQTPLVCYYGKRGGGSSRKLRTALLN